MRAVRNARAEYGVEEKARVAATIVVEGDSALRAALEAEIQVVGGSGRGRRGQEERAL